jgi:DeoR/GlpR family transcriptional regulator of sugar metabolism
MTASVDKQHDLSIPPTYDLIAECMQVLAPETEGVSDFPGSMLSNLESKLLIGSNVLEYMRDRITRHDKLYFAMSTTCHLLCERMVDEGSIAQHNLEVYTSSLPLVMSAQLRRVHCHVYGSYLVHEYASLTFTDHQFEDLRASSQWFDHVFIGARGVEKFGKKFEVRTCKQEHSSILQDVMSRARRTVVILFDSSKLECADGASFMVLAPKVSVELQPDAELLILTDKSGIDTIIGRNQFKEFEGALRDSQFQVERDSPQIRVWRLNRPRPHQEKGNDKSR